ncbi:MAG: hypothetical protein J5U17_04365 [Candidatus Methanoperedens sp.]|nr:hypothetical protein [Candidatus Methanoperedens sp.]MCE8424991.1 hypothetical protein [Candidatus Methanoperedens sp.]MCE8427425.1 hypothetical protein [Candidatus Methanoperedens sp.]
MEQQNIYKILAAIMILTMIIVPVAYVITSPTSDLAANTSEQTNTQEKYNPEFWTVNQPFYSISDALNMTPPGAESASFVDLESMPPQMVQWVRQDMQVIGEVDTIYKSNTTRMYYANLREKNNSSFLLLSTMFPEKNDFGYMEIPNTSPPILQRTDMNGLYNVMGRPSILASGETVMGVLSITESLNKTNTSYDQYEKLINLVPAAPFQTLSSNVTFSEQYYMGIKLNNGSYERTTAYLNLNSSTMKNLTMFKANSTQKGFSHYNITQAANYTIVDIISPDFFTILTEGIS